MLRVLSWAAALSLFAASCSKAFADEPKKDGGPPAKAERAEPNRPPEPPPPPPRDDDGAFPPAPPPPRPEAGEPELDDEDDGPRRPRPPRGPDEPDGPDRPDGARPRREGPRPGEAGRPDELPRKNSRSLPRKVERGELKERREPPERGELTERRVRKAVRPGETPPPRSPEQPVPPRMPMERSQGRGFGGGLMGGGPGGMGEAMMGGRGMGPMGGSPGFGHDDPQMMKLAEADRKLEVDSRRLAEQIRRSRGPAGSTGDGPSLEDMKKKLAIIVEEHFKIRQEKRKLELERLEKQLVKLRESVRNRDDKKSSLIERRLAELIGAEDTGF